MQRDGAVSSETPSPSKTARLPSLKGRLRAAAAGDGVAATGTNPFPLAAGAVSAPSAKTLHLCAKRGIRMSFKISAGLSFGAESVPKRASLSVSVRFPSARIPHSARISLPPGFPFRPDFPSPRIPHSSKGFHSCSAIHSFFGPFFPRSAFAPYSASGLPFALVRFRRLLAEPHPVRPPLQIGSLIPERIACSHAPKRRRRPRFRFRFPQKFLLTGRCRSAWHFDSWDPANP